MRIAIDYRVLSTEAADRGMGRYTQQQLREVLNHDTENQYFLLCYPKMRKDLVDPKIKSAKNVKFLSVDFEQLKNPGIIFPSSQTLAFSSQLQDLLYKHQIDLYHATTPFIGPALPDFDVCPYISTLYDLIPLIYPREYFNDENLAQNYRMVLRFLRGSRKIVSISSSAKTDSYYHLGYPLEDNTVAYPIIDPVFRPMGEREALIKAQGLLDREGIPSQFIFSVTGIHFSKNIKLLLNTYEKLQKINKDAFHLVICFPSQAARQQFEFQFGDREGIHCVHAISEEELTAFYNLSQFVVHPSIYEGFGYPVAEAMACGTPVITTKSSSLEEIGNDAAILVDPLDSDELMEAMQSLMDKPEHKAEMAEKGLASIKRFSPEQLGLNTLAAYQGALSPHKQPSQKKKRLAVFSSMPPLHCGVADYTSELVQAVSKDVDVEVFVDGDYLPKDILNSDFIIHHYESFLRRREQKGFDAVIYQMGATFYQYFMYPFISEYPGIVVFHDLIMGLGFFFIYSDKNDLGTFRQKILMQEGADVLKQFNNWRDKNIQDFTELDVLFREKYLLNWIMKNSPAQIVHMNDAKNELEAQYPNSNVSVVQMGVRDMLEEHGFFATEVYKIRANIPVDHLVIGIFGSVVKVKRIEACLRAVKGLAEKNPKVLLLIVGSQIQSDYYQSLQDLIRELDIKDNVLFTGRTSQEEFDNYFLSTDLVINLRYPSYKGMSAILVRAFSAGKPAIISDIPEWQDFPDTFCFKVAPDEDEAEHILEHLRRINDDPEYLSGLKKEARAYFERYHTVDHMAQQYLDIVDNIEENKNRKA